MREVDFPIERDPAEAWADFVGWRVNYERSAYAVAAAVDAGAGALVGPAPAPRSRHRPNPPGAWTTTQVGRVRRRRGSH